MDVAPGRVKPLRLRFRKIAKGRSEAGKRETRSEAAELSVGRDKQIDWTDLESPPGLAPENGQVAIQRRLQCQALRQ